MGCRENPYHERLLLPDTVPPGNRDARSASGMPLRRSHVSPATKALHSGSSPATNRSSDHQHETPAKLDRGISPNTAYNGLRRPPAGQDQPPRLSLRSRTRWFATTWATAVPSASRDLSTRTSNEHSDRAASTPKAILYRPTKFTPGEYRFRSHGGIAGAPPAPLARSLAGPRMPHSVALFNRG